MTQEPAHDLAEEPENDSFFAFAEDGDDYERGGNSRSRWITVAMVLLSVIASIALCIFGIRSLANARDNAGYEDKTWVMSGTYVDLTPDLQTKSNVAMYAGSVPGDDQLKGITFKSDLNDPQQIQPGQTIQFRGSQTGSNKEDFPTEVDALLAKTWDHQVEVVRTGDKGSLKPVTASLITQERVVGWGSLLGALLIFAGGVTGAVLLNRRARYADDDE